MSSMNTIQGFIKMGESMEEAPAIVGYHLSSRRIIKHVCTYASIIPFLESNLE